MSKKILPEGYYMIDSSDNQSLIRLYEETKTNYKCLTEKGSESFIAGNRYHFYNGVFNPTEISGLTIKAEDVLDLKEWTWVMSSDKKSETIDLYETAGKNLAVFSKELSAWMSTDIASDIIMRLIDNGVTFGLPVENSYYKGE